jgi:hypothetical protein
MLMFSPSPDNWMWFRFVRKFEAGIEIWAGIETPTTPLLGIFYPLFYPSFLPLFFTPLFYRTCWIGQRALRWADGRWAMGRSRRLGFPRRLQDIIYRKCAYRRSLLDCPLLTCSALRAQHQRKAGSARTLKLMAWVELRYGHPYGWIRHGRLQRRHKFSKICFSEVFQNALLSTFGPRGSPPGGSASMEKAWLLRAAIYVD